MEDCEQDFCVSCGKSAEVSDRRLINSPSTSSILPHLRSLLVRRIKAACNFNNEMAEMSVKRFIDLSSAYMCRSPCYTAYKSLVDKEKQLYDRSANVVVINKIRECCVPVPQSYHGYDTPSPLNYPVMSIKSSLPKVPPVCTPSRRTMRRLMGITNQSPPVFVSHINLK